MTALYRQYPPDSTPPAQPSKPARPSVPCPYCDTILSALRANMLPGVVTRHKRNVHPIEFESEVMSRRMAILEGIHAVETVKVSVSSCYNASARYPAVKVARVPVSWGVEACIVVISKHGKYIAYPVGKVREGEGWELTAQPLAS